MIKYKFNPYKRKDGAVMLYLNGFNNGYQCVSLGIGEYVKSSKLTNGQKNALSAVRFIKDKIENEGFSYDYEKHNELKNKLDYDIELLITDIAEVGGQKTGADGAYIGYNGKAMSLFELNEALADLE